MAKKLKPGDRVWVQGIYLSSPFGRCHVIYMPPEPGIQPDCQRMPDVLVAGSTPIKRVRKQKDPTHDRR